MAEVDYQMALLLQYKFEQENKRKENTDSDYKLALELQEQFAVEVAVERPTNNLVYKAPAVPSSSKCLTDPSWEIIDPTPDIHVLFVAFNQRFFWNALNSVTVAWSKKMTSCAGICSYQGRGGMCSITLSEPLLKLRPRKDLVETLLHEMIHAYLFVTNNNRDRDGHGPEFHKHMYRINAEAGTNITVYHDFHDEVKFYQQHWWRCNGPCQNRKPYFGIVRRATNRAPGVNDRWWDDHMRTCGGSFIKVKNPETATTTKKSNKKIAEPPKTNTSDIRNYIKTASSQTKSITSEIPKPTTITKPLPSNNIQTISNNKASTPQISNVIRSKTSNIFGFTNFSGSKNANKPVGGTAVKNAGSSTFVVTNKGHKTSTETEKTSTISNSADIKPFSGQGNVLSSSSPNNTRDYSAVRDYWLKKFEYGNNNNTKRSASTSDDCRSPQKVRKRPSSISSDSRSPQKLPKCSNNDVECPICTKKFTMEDLNGHLDICLESNSDKNLKECFICGENICDIEYEKHVSDCAVKHFSCNNLDDDDDNEVPVETKNCPLCKKTLNFERYDIHVQECTSSMCNELDKTFDLIPTTPKTSCLACGKDILKTELDLHLEDCLGMSNVFDTSKVVSIEDEDSNSENNDLNVSYNCPFCLKLIIEDDMQAHLDECLKANMLNDCKLRDSFFELN